MHPQVDIVRTPTPIRSTATAGSHFARPLARSLLNPEKPMRLNLFAITFLATFTTACVGEISAPRKPGRDKDPTTPDATCSKVEKDVTVRSAADMIALPRTGCYDIYGKLTLQGSVITSLQMLNELNSVNELEIDHTNLTRIDTKRPVGIYGRLTVTGNSKLLDLKQLSFETAAKGILIDGNPVLASVDALSLDDPKLDEVDGDLAITGNPALTAVPLKYLTKVTGAVTISSNGAVRTIDVSNLGTTKHVEIAENAQLSLLTGFAADTVDGDLAIRDNPVLTSLGSMPALYRVTGNLTIDNNAALANLAAFTTKVKFVDQSLAIRNNQNLTDLGQLKHLALVGSITITNNHNLVNCRAVEIDRCTQHPPNSSVINSNGTTNCNWQCN